MPQFDLSTFTSQIFWLSLVIFILYFVFSKFILPKAESIIFNRNKCYEDSIIKAEIYNNKVKAMRVVYDEKLANVEEKILITKKQASQFLQDHFAKQEKELHNKIEKEEKDMLEKLDTYSKEFKSTEYEHAIRLAAIMIEKLTNNPTDTKLLKKIAQSYQK